MSAENVPKMSEDHDIPVQIGTWDWAEKWSYPVANCQVTYLTFNIPTSDKGSARPVRDAPVLVAYEKCIVMPYHERGNLGHGPRASATIFSEI